jgi:signal transduction histidine kinase
LSSWRSRLARLGSRPTRATVLGLLLVTAVPLLAVVVLSLANAQQQSEARVVEERVALARVVAQRVDAVIGDTVSGLRSVAQTEDVVDSAPTVELGRILARVAATNRHLQDVAVFGADGRLVAGGGAPAGSVSIADRPFFRRAIESGQPTVSGAIVGRLSGVATATVSVPFIRANGERAIIGAPLALDTLFDGFASGNLGLSVSLTLVDADGELLTRLANGDPRLPLSPDRADVLAVRRGETGAMRLRAADGAELIATFAPVASAEWGVVLLEPAEVAFGQTRAGSQVVLVLLAAALLAALAGGWWLGGRLDAYSRREQRARSVAEAAAERTARLQAVTAALSGTLTHRAVADVALAHGSAAVAARAGWVHLRTPDGEHLELLQSLGLPEELLVEWRHYPLDRASAISDAARLAEPVYLGSPEEALSRYPGTLEAVRTTGNGAWAAAPLVVGDRCIGALGFSFAEPRAFDRADRDLIETIARQCAQAMERARLYDGERSARLDAEAASRRVGFLASASRLLAASLDHERTLQQVARLAVPELADWCVVDLCESDGTLRRIAVVHADSRCQHLTAQLQQRYSLLAPGSSHTAARVIASGRSWFDPTVSPTRLAAEARDAEHLALLQGLGFTGEMVVPLVGREGVLGAITLVAATPARRYGADELALAEELAQRCAIAIENARLYGETRGAVAARDEFLAIASHELLTPVTSLRGHAQLLRRSLGLSDALDPERLGRHAQAVVDGADRLTALVRDLLDVARIRTERMVLRTAPIDLGAFVRSVAERERERVGPAHTFLVELPDGPCFAEADPQRLDQVLVNLLDNAVKYSPEGGVISMSLAASSDVLRLAVTDQGMGIPGGALEKIFEPFGRAPNAERSSVPGLGLGLHVCRDIVERHGGRLWAESAGEGEGATFVVELPVELPREGAVTGSGDRLTRS